MALLVSNSEYSIPQHYPFDQKHFKYIARKIKVGIITHSNFGLHQGFFPPFGFH